MSNTTAPTHDRIRLTGLSARGYHGVFPSERAEGQVFLADVELRLGSSGTSLAAAIDALEHTVDYGAVASAVVDIIEGEPVNLLETLAARIADAVLAFEGVYEAEVTIHKPQAPLEVAFEDVSLTIVRSRSGVQEIADAEAHHDLAQTASALADSALGVASLPPVAAPAVATAPVPEELPVAAVQEEPAPESADDEADVQAEAVEDAQLEPEPVDLLDVVPSAPVEAVLALGGNVGGVVPALRKAVHALSSTEGITVTSVAPLARTAAVIPPDGQPQPDYLNTVVLVATTLSPRALLDVCMSLEEAAGRVRTTPKGPRTLDVDVVTYEGVRSEDPELTLPHPRAAERAFVLVPWAQADPFAEIGDASVAALAEQAPDRGGVRWLALDWLDSDHLPALPTGQYVAPPAAELFDEAEAVGADEESGDADSLPTPADAHQGQQESLSTPVAEVASTPADTPEMVDAALDAASEGEAEEITEAASDGRPDDEGVSSEEIAAEESETEGISADRETAEEAVAATDAVEEADAAQEVPDVIDDAAAQDHQESEELPHRPVSHVSQDVPPAPAPTVQDIEEAQANDRASEHVADTPAPHDAQGVSEDVGEDREDSFDDTADEHADKSAARAASDEADDDDHADEASDAAKASDGVGHDDAERPLAPKPLPDPDKTWSAPLSWGEVLGRGDDKAQ